MAAPEALGAERWLSDAGRRFTAASLSGLVGQFAGIPDVITLHAGLPPPASFPLTGIQLTTDKPLLAGTEGQPGSNTVHIQASSDVIAAQQYIFSAGHPPLLSWVKDQVQQLHAPQAPCGYACALTSGAVHALGLATQVLLNPGDWLVMDEYTYSHVIETVMLPHGVRPLPVRMDEQGMDPDHLEQQLQKAHREFNLWQAHQQQAGVVNQDLQVNGAGPGHAMFPWSQQRDGLPPPTRPPSAIYLIPTGHNPTGITLSPERRARLYEVCRRFDLLILEDDAYFYLYWGDLAERHSSQVATAGGVLSSEAAAPQAAPKPPPSFLSMDADGRVLRVDTLAKVLGPGFRLGWVTGPPLLVDKIALAAQGSCVGASSLSQVVVWKLLEAWGPQGWSHHLASLRGLYSRKAAVLVAAVRKHLGGVARWVGGVPQAGMFMWFEILGGPGDLGPPSGSELEAALLKARVVGVPGALFRSDTAAAKAGTSCPYLRLTFAFLPEEQLEVGVARLGAALKELQADRAATRNHHQGQQQAGVTGQQEANNLLEQVQCKTPEHHLQFSSPQTQRRSQELIHHHWRDSRASAGSTPTAGAGGMSTFTQTLHSLMLSEEVCSSTASVPSSSPCGSARGSTRGVQHPGEEGDHKE